MTESPAAAAESTHELDAAPWTRVETTIMATAASIRATYDSRFAPIDLNLTQASMLAYAVDFGPAKQSAMAEHLSIGRAAAGTIVDALEKRGLVERNPDPDDRRVWLVSVTDKGRDLVVQVAEIDGKLRAELRQDITRAERQQLAKVLVCLQKNLSTARAEHTE